LRINLFNYLRFLADITAIQAANIPAAVTPIIPLLSPVVLLSTDDD
jgi:hypothetical protein